MAYFMQCFVLNFGSVELSYSTFYFKLNDLTVKGRIWFIETVQKITLHIQKLFQNNLPGIGSFHIYVGFVLLCLTIDLFFFHRLYGKALVSLPINRFLQTGMLFKQMCGFNREDVLYKNHLSADRPLVTRQFHFTVLVVPKVTQLSLICRIQC